MVDVRSSATRPVVVYRGQLHTEWSRVSYLLEAMTVAYGDLDVVYLAPQGATREAEVRTYLSQVPGARLVAYLDGRASGLVTSMRHIRSVGRNARLLLVIGSTSIYYARAIPEADLVWCINGIPEERLVVHDSRGQRVLVRALWWSTTLGRPPRLVIVVSGPMRDLVLERFDVATFVAPCCVELSTFAPPPDTPIRSYVTYLGSAAPWQGLEHLSLIWESMHHIDGSLRFRAISTDPNARVLGRGLPNSAFEMVGASAPGLVATRLWEASATCLIRQPNLVNRVSFPMKFGESLASGAPVIVSKMGWDIESVIERTGAGRAIDWNQPAHHVAASIVGFLQTPPDDLQHKVRIAAAMLDRRQWIHDLAGVLAAVPTSGPLHPSPTIPESNLAEMGLARTPDDHTLPPSSPVETGNQKGRFHVSPTATLSVLSEVWRHPANRNHRFQRVGDILLFHARGRMTGRANVTPLGDHSRIWASPHSPAIRAVHANPPDWPEMQAWRRLLRPGTLFVDVGANIGLYTIWALDCGADVIAVEPNEAAMSQLRRNLELNNYGVDFIAAALSNRPGTMRLVGPDLPRQHLAVGNDANASGSAVQVVTLDSVLGQRTADGVKIDVEGAETLVLEGAVQALAEQRIKALQLEWNDCSQTLLGEDRSSTTRLLASFGYELFRPDDNGVLERVKAPAYGRDVFAMPLP